MTVCGRYFRYCVGVLCKEECDSVWKACVKENMALAVCGRPV